MLKKFEKVMAANRGEIAVRIFRACNELGIKTMAIYSKEDSLSLFRTKSDESYLIGDNLTPVGAYLNIERIVSLAKKKGADAIHPGYGFLSENAKFAKACEDAGITFIGPSAKTLSQMGDKIEAKKLAQSCNVPTIPGSKKPLESLEEATKLANEYGYPVILKAAAGGGGRGMRRANDDKELALAYDMVKEEALKAFGSDEIFVEKYLVEPKHIEVQILADKYGNVVHLYERDCSVQRRFQKVIEFAPAFSVDKKVLESLYADAIKIAKAVNYVNAGTVEFLVDKSGNHYFIEMNPRIQVEHTVTEMVTGFDLVQAQVLIAEGYALNSPEIGIYSQEDIKPRGYAIQCRVTTEDPVNNFLPDTGKITTYRSGGGFGVRLDAGNAFAGAVISPYYDSLLVKITTYDRTFEGTIQKAIRSIGEIRIRGVKTNIAFLGNILRNETFVKGNCHTKFIDETPSLFKIAEAQDRATKILKHLGTLIINNKGTEKPVFEKPRVPEEYTESCNTGLKQKLDELGPKAFADWILAQNKLFITDTTMRDAHQSLLATRVRTRDMRLISKATSNILADAFSLEMWGGATFDVAYRFLSESPWTRLDNLREKIPNIPFQMLLRGANAVGYTNYPDNLIKAFIKESASSGIDIFRIFDSLNWLPGMELAIDEVLKSGKLCEGTICYTGDVLDKTRTKYSLEYYINLAKELERKGVHTLAIKDMAGLLKPYAAKELVSALKQEVGIPIHLHTHDTSGNQVATCLMAAEAGVDIVDLAISSMASLTSQPSLNSVVAALERTPRDPGFNLDELTKLSNYWEDVRKMYKPFESGLNCPHTDIYRYEIPGGQYSNLRPQVESLGLGPRFDEVKEKYREVNLMLGDLIKVTPSSKMVGDLAIFMVQNDLTAENIVEKGKTLSFPESTVNFFKGMMGQPYGGFPKDIQEVVLKGDTPITCRPGELLAPCDFEKSAKDLEALTGKKATNRAIIAWCLYPKVVEQFIKNNEANSDLSHMETSVFFYGLNPGESTTMRIEAGKTLMIKYISKGESNGDGTRNMIFELNGIRREVAVEDPVLISDKKAIRMADPDNNNQIGSPLPGNLSKILVKQDQKVEKGDVIAIVEAMKMEVSIIAPISGIVKEIVQTEKSTVVNGELLFIIK